MAAIGVVPLDDEFSARTVGFAAQPIRLGNTTRRAARFGTGPLESAKRELLERNGAEGNRGIGRRIQCMHLSNSVTDRYSIIYLARRLQHDAEPGDFWVANGINCLLRKFTRWFCAGRAL